jgi:FCD domain
MRKLAAESAFAWMLRRRNEQRGDTHRTDRTSCNLVEIDLDSYTFDDGSGKDFDPKTRFQGRGPVCARAILSGGSRATFRAAQQIASFDLRQLASSIESFRKAIHKLDTRDHLELDAGFHRTILRASGNRRLADFVDTLRDLQMRRGFLIAPKARDLDEICADHQRIYERLAANDSFGAAEAMREHLSLSARLLIAEESGEQEDGKFALNWIDFIDLHGKCLNYQASPSSLE